MDVVLTTTGGELLQKLKTENNRVAFFTNMVDASIESYKNHEHKTLPLDFLFCGRAYNSSRTKIIKRLIISLPELKSEVWGCLGNTPITGHAFYKKLSQASSSLKLPFYTSGWMTQLLGNGLLTFTPETPGMRTLFPPEEVAYYQDDTDLIEKIKYYAQNINERSELASRGWKRAHESYNVKRVTKFMLETIFRTI